MSIINKRSIQMSIEANSISMNVGNFPEGRLISMERTLEMHSKLLVEIRNMINFIISGQKINSSDFGNRFNSMKQSDIEKSEEKPEKRIVDSTINDIFNCTTAEVAKKELIIEPIDISIGGGSSIPKTVQGNYETLKERKKPMLVLNSIKTSRNSRIDKSTTAVNTLKNSKNSLREGGSPIDVNRNAPRENECAKTFQGNSFKSTRKNSNSNEGEKTHRNDPNFTKKVVVKSYTKRGFAALPGNCLDLVAKFIGNKLFVFLCNKEILCNYSKHKLKQVKEKIAHYKQSSTASSDDPSVIHVINDRNVNLN